MLAPLPSRRSLLHSCLSDWCWSVESTCDIQSLGRVISSLRVLKLSSPIFAFSTPFQEAAPLLWHRSTAGCYLGEISHLASLTTSSSHAIGSRSKMFLATTKRDLWNGCFTMDYMHPYSPMTQVPPFQSNLRTMMPCYQHLLHRDWQHVNLLIGFENYRWNSSLQCLLRSRYSIQQRSPQDIEKITFLRFPRHSSLHSTGYANMFMASLSFLS